MKKNLLFLIGSFFFYFHSQAQMREWVHDYNGTSLAEDGPNAIVVDTAGNSYVAGYTEGAVSRAFGTIKYNSSGVEQWVARYDATTKPDYGNAIAIDRNGNIYVAGLVTKNTTDYGTIKYDNGGSDQWSVTFDGGSHLADEAKAIAADANGNVYITGQATDSSGKVAIGTIKYNSSGVLQWVQYFNGSGDSTDTGVGIAVDAAGNVYVAGNTMSSTGGQNYVAIKYSSSGNQLWATEFNGSGNKNDTVRAMTLDLAGNVYITGSAMGGASVSNYGTVKFSNAGTLLWSKEYNGSGNGYDAASDIAVDSSGNIYVTGADLNSNSISDYTTVKYSSSGTLLWTKTFDGSSHGDDRANGIAVDIAGNVYVTGQSTGSADNLDYLTLMYDTNGNLQWSDAYNGPSDNDDIAVDIALDPGGNAYVTGKSGSIGASIGFTTIKYKTVSSVGFSGTLPDPVLVPYPNPTAGTFILQTSMLPNEKYVFHLQNILGEDINVTCTQKSETTEIDMRDQPAGVYFIELCSGSTVYKGKIIRQ